MSRFADGKDAVTEFRFGINGNSVPILYPTKETKARSIQSRGMSCPPRLSSERAVHVDLVCGANVNLAIHHGGNRELYRRPSRVAASGLTAVV
jgi:hypothetical protein